MLSRDTWEQVQECVDEVNSGIRELQERREGHHGTKVHVLDIHQHFDPALSTLHSTSLRPTCPPQHANTNPACRKPCKALDESVAGGCVGQGG